MKKKIIIGSIGILACTALVYFFLEMRHAPVTNYPPKNKTIVAFGDSLVAGVGATEENDLVSVLSRKLGRDIINLGVSGNTTEDGLLRVDEVIEHDPGIVILLLGGNDSLRRISEEVTRKNLVTLIETFEKHGSVVVLLGVRGNIIGNSREKMYQELADTYGAVYVDDILDGVFLHKELMSDGIHPNDAGYAIIAERLQDVFSENDL